MAYKDGDMKILNSGSASDIVYVDHTSSAVGSATPQSSTCPDALAEQIKNCSIRAEVATAEVDKGSAASPKLLRVN